MMLLKKHRIIILLTSILFSGCNRSSFGINDDSNGILIHRFDSILFQWIDTDDSNSLQWLISEYPQMLGLLGKSLFQTNYADSSAFFGDLKKYYSEPTLKSLYSDAIAFYATHSPVTERIEKECTSGFNRLKAWFPALQIPAVYMHVSGLRQNIIVADSLLSFSIDKYMGAGYPLYKNFFYDYQLKSMIPERVAIDGLYAWLTSEFPLQAEEPVLLDKLIYEGKISYLLTQTGTDYSLQQIIPFTDNEYQWCLKNEPALWKTLIDRNHLDEKNALMIARYFQPAPSSFMAADAPGNLGNFIGYRIVERYMKQTKSSCEQLMRNNNAKEILQKSKYKP